MYHDAHGEGTVVSRSAEGEIEVKFDNGEAHAYNLASQRKLRPILEDAHTLSATALFNMVDADSSGTIELPEFKYMHTMVLNSERRAAGKVSSIEKMRKLYKAVAIFAGVALIATVIVLVLLQVLVEEVITKEQFVKHSVCPSWGNMGDGFTNFQGDIIATTPAKRNLPLYVAPVLPVGERESLSVMTISYRDPSVHEFMVEAGMIGENDTSVEYPTVEETVTVLSFKSFNATAANLEVVPADAKRRTIRILNGEATLVTTRADGTSYYAALCAGKVSCAAFTIETGIADAFIEQANGNLTAIGVEVPTGRRLESNVASIHRRLSESGDCPCVDGWVKYKGEWVQPTDEEAAEAGYEKSDTVGACGCVTWVKKEGARRELFEGDVCEDAADELVKQITEEALGRTLSSCVEVKNVGGCEHELAKMHCPADVRAVRRARRAGGHDESPPSDAPARQVLPGAHRTGEASCGLAFSQAGAMSHRQRRLERREE